VETDQGELTAARLLLAIGRSALHWPEWAADGRAAGAAIQHIFAPDFSLDGLPDWNELVVVGGGITAAQVALRLAERWPGTMTILSRHPIREEQFDSKPGWLGPRYQNGFRPTPDYEQPRRMIRAARLRGSMPPDTTLRPLRLSHCRPAVMLATRTVRQRPAGGVGDWPHCPQYLRGAAGGLPFRLAGWRPISCVKVCSLWRLAAPVNH
jgi:hypothetical protein